jgi:hypothetical protein
VQVTQTVEQALQSIAGKYSMVYWYDGSNRDDPWKVYAANLGAWARPWVNDLNELRFGESYWISLTQVITLQLNGGAASALMAHDEPEGSVGPSGFDGNVQSPPATYYGVVQSGFNFTPAPGMPVTAWINGRPCGQGKTLQVNGEIVYTLNVFADGPGGAAGCGVPGRAVMFKVGDRSMSPVVAWDNNQLREVSLSGVHRVYLPVILKNR